MNTADNETLALKFRNRRARADTNVTASWRGTGVQFARMSSPEPYVFAWCGDTHYIALHDLVLNDGRMIIDDQAPVPGGDLRDLLTYVPPGCAVSGWAHPAERANSFTVLYFDPEVISEELDQRYAGDDLRSLVYFRDEGLASTLRKLQNILTSPFLDDALLAETASLVAAIEVKNAIDRHATPLRSPSGLSAAQERLVRDFIEENLAGSFGLTEIAAVAGLSRFHFSRAFKETFGISPVRYVNSRRVERARDMLSNGTTPVRDVAKHLGFGSLSQFNRTFKNLVGESPLSFRRKQA